MPKEWKQVHIVHQKHEIEFGHLVSGTPVPYIISERIIHIPGNDALLKADIHFCCSLSNSAHVPHFGLSMGNKDAPVFSGAYNAPNMVRYVRYNPIVRDMTYGKRLIFVNITQ